jgi:hypothetical protein
LAAPGRKPAVRFAEFGSERGSQTGRRQLYAQDIVRHVFTHRNPNPPAPPKYQLREDWTIETLPGRVEELINKNAELTEMDQLCICPVRECNIFYSRPDARLRHQQLKGHW